ncbi:MAG: DUF1249 domain-containing protein [Methylococcaceae bacterium]|nr:DUF1249 domain-containing protein [Methylococcaceae bacterium]
MSLLEPTEKSYWLAKLCEENYQRLVRLIPELADPPESAVARADGKPSLHLKLLEHNPYTVTLELTHCFSRELQSLLEPAVKIRVYLDARAAEVLSDHERPRVHEAFSHAGNAREVMDYKWSLNYFLTQWLEHCLACDYRFALTHTERESCEEAA